MSTEENSMIFTLFRKFKRKTASSETVLYYIPTQKSQNIPAG